MPQAIVITMSVIMLCLAMRPVALINLYFIFRPLVHPFAVEQLRLVGLPINWPFAAVVIVGACALAFSKKNFRLVPYNSASLYLLLVLSLLTAATTINLTATVSQTIKFLNALSLVLVVTCAASDKKKIIAIYKGIAISSIVPMIYGYYQFIVGAGHLVHGEHTNRITSFFAYANLYGMFLAHVLFVSLILYFEEPTKKWKRIYGVIFVSSVISTIMALNRGSWIAIVAGFVFSFPFYRRYLSLKWFIAGVAVVAVGASGVVIQRFLELEQGVLGADTFGARLDLAAAILGSIGDIPILGYGAGTAQLVLETKFGQANVPHNDYLRLLLEMGVLAPIIYFILLVKEAVFNIKFRKIASAWHVNYFTLAIIVYFSVISSVQNIVHDAVIFPLFLVCCVLARRYTRLAMSEHLSKSKSTSSRH